MGEPYPLFSQLDATGLFHRDTPVGRIFHPGTISYREISAGDSVHITVSSGNRVAVHVDSLSPLVLRERACRYSIVRAVGHNVVHAVEAVVRLCRRRRGEHRCQLDCEVAVAEDVGRPLYEFSCRAAGAEGCGWSTRAATEDELVAKVAEHARRVHGVKSFSATIAAYAVQVGREQAGAVANA